MSKVIKSSLIIKYIFITIKKHQQYVVGTTKQLDFINSMVTVKVHVSEKWVFQSPHILNHLIHLLVTCPC